MLEAFGALFGAPYDLRTQNNFPTGFRPPFSLRPLLSRRDGNGGCLRTPRRTGNPLPRGGGHRPRRARRSPPRLEDKLSRTAALHRALRLLGHSHRARPAPAPRLAARVCLSRRSARPARVAHLLCSSHLRRSPSRSARDALPRLPRRGDPPHSTPADPAHHARKDGHPHGRPLFAAPPARQT